MSSYQNLVILQNFFQKTEYQDFKSALLNSSVSWEEYIALMRDGCVCLEHWSMIQTVKNQNTGRKSRCIATLSTTNPKWIGKESNLGLHGDRLKSFWPVPMLWSGLHGRQFNLRDLSEGNIFSLHTHTIKCDQA